MKGYLIFLSILFIIYGISIYTSKSGFNKLYIKRQFQKTHLNEGEDLKISIIVENRKLMAIPFMLIRENMPIQLKSYIKENVTKYNVYSNEKIIKTYKLNIKKRGVYLFRDMDVVLGDIFGLNTSNKKIEDYNEIVVYPKVKDINKIKFENSNYQGDMIVKRWIYKDTIYVKSIREYSVGDRMKDIHWNTSLKKGQLMVKEYDFTSDKQIVIILNTQCSEPYWYNVDNKSLEKGIDASIAISNSVINSGFLVSVWTNSGILSYLEKFPSETIPSTNLKSILEIMARLDHTPRIEFSQYLIKNIKLFKKENIYVIVAAYLNEKDLSILNKLRKIGYNFKIVDVSPKGNLPSLTGIEKLYYRGENIL